MFLPRKGTLTLAPGMVVVVVGGRGGGGGGGDHLGPNIPKHFKQTLKNIVLHILSPGREL